MSNLKFNGYKVSEMSFKNVAENGTKLQLQNSCSFNVSYSNDSKKCVAQLTAEVSDKEKADIFNIRLVIVASFDVLDTTVAKEKLHVQAYNQLFPYARSVISTITVNAGIPPIYLSEIDIEKRSIYKIDKNPPKEFE